MQSECDAWRQLVATSGCVEAALEARRGGGAVSLSSIKKQKQRLGHRDSAGLCVCFLTFRRPRTRPTQ